MYQQIIEGIIVYHLTLSPNDNISEQTLEGTLKRSSTRIAGLKEASSETKTTLHKYLS